jgi:Tfp pilus assembly PilM family ATPase
MDANDNSAYIGIEITHSDLKMRQLYFEQFLQLKKLLHSFLKEDWLWQIEAIDEDGKAKSKIGQVSMLWN